MSSCIFSIFWCVYPIFLSTSSMSVLISDCCTIISSCCAFLSMYYSRRSACAKRSSSAFSVSFSTLFDYSSSSFFVEANSSRSFSRDAESSVCYFPCACSSCSSRAFDLLSFPSSLAIKVLGSVLVIWIFYFSMSLISFCSSLWSASFCRRRFSFVSICLSIPRISSVNFSYVLLWMSPSRCFIWFCFSYISLATLFIAWASSFILSIYAVIYYSSWVVFCISSSRRRISASCRIRLSRFLKSRPPDTSPEGL